MKVLTEAEFREVYVKAYTEHGDYTPSERDIRLSWEAYQRNPAGHFISKEEYS